MNVVLMIYVTYQCLMWRHSNSTNAVISHPYVCSCNKCRGAIMAEIAIHVFPSIQNSIWRLQGLQFPWQVASCCILEFFGPGSNLRNCRRQYSVYFTLSLVPVCRDTSFIVVLVSATMKGVCKMFEEPVQNMQFENFV